MPFIRIPHRTTLNDFPLYICVNDTIYNSPESHLTNSYTTASPDEMKNYIIEWLNSNLGDSEIINFPFPSNPPQNSIPYIDCHSKIFNFYYANPVLEESGTINSLDYANVILPAISVAQYDGNTSRIAATGGPSIIPGYIQSLIGPLTSFTGYFVIFPSTILNGNKYNFENITTSNYAGLLSFVISFINNTCRIDGYGINYQHIPIDRTALSILKSWNNIEVEYYTAGTDPYTNILTPSTTGGGNGSGDFEDETIDEPPPPSLSGLNSGFISAYSPSVGQLNALASYMWTSDFATNLNKVFGDNPMGTILGLSAIPVSPITGSSQNVILGNIDTQIEMPVITSQYVKFNCGSINIQPKYGAFLDYEPYTSIDLFLPYIGLVQLSTNDVMGKSLAVTYTIDVLSGACVANVACGGTIMYTFEGACATQFPVTNNDYSNMFKAAIDAASSIVGAIGGAVASGMTGNVAGAVGAIADGMAGAAQAAMNAHPVVNRSGSLSGSAGLMGIQKPFIVWTTPNMVASNNQNSFIGYPNFITTSLSSLSGYTEVENINLGIAGATNEEVNEIKTLLRNGVIF